MTYTAKVTDEEDSLPNAATPTGTVRFWEEDSEGNLERISCLGDDPEAPGEKELQPDVASQSGEASCTVSYSSPGTHIIVAEYLGDDPNYLGSTSGKHPQTVNQANTSTELTSSVNPSVVGQTVTYTALVTVDDPGSGTPTGTVDFLDGTTVICNDVSHGASTPARCDTTFPVGEHFVTAAYSGSTEFKDSTSNEVKQTVGQASTTTSLSPGNSTTVSGQSVTYTALVTVDDPGSGTPTGTIDFMDGTTVICNDVLLDASHVPTCDTTFPVGTHVLTAAYSGDTELQNSTSAPVTQTVDQVSTTTVLSSSDNPSTSGQQVTYTAVVTRVETGSTVPAGNVVFKDGSTAISGCGGATGKTLDASGVASCVATYQTVGNRTITATYLGNADFKSSTSNTVTQTVGYAIDAVVSSRSSAATGGDPIQASFTISGSPPANYTLCVKLTGEWKPQYGGTYVSPPPTTGKTASAIGFTDKCKNYTWSSGSTSTRTLGNDFGFGGPGVYQATWKITVAGQQVRLIDTVPWADSSGRLVACPPDPLLQEGVWLQGKYANRHTVIDRCRVHTGTIVKVGKVGRDKDRGITFTWGSTTRKAEYMARDHIDAAPFNAKPDRLKLPVAGEVWTIEGVYLCDRYHTHYELGHPTLRATKGSETWVTGPQYNDREPTMTGSWSIKSCGTDVQP